MRASVYDDKLIFQHSYPKGLFFGTHASNFFDKPDMALSIVMCSLQYLYRSFHEHINLETVDFWLWLDTGRTSSLPYEDVSADRPLSVFPRLTDTVRTKTIDSLVCP